MIRRIEWLITRFDTDVDKVLNHFRGNVAADRLFYGASAAGDMSRIWHLINMVRFIVSPRRRPEAVRLAVGLAVESLLVNQGIKRFFSRKRPDFDMMHPYALRRPSTSSFPSGHASSAAYAVTLLGQHDRRWRPLYVCIGLIVSMSRPFVRVHHASDVVAGGALGWVLARVTRRLWPIR